MTRPHEALGFHAPIGRRLPSGLVAWNLLILSSTVLFAFVYVIRVNTTSASSFRVQEAERHIEELKTVTMSMQDKLSSLSSLQELATKAGGNGYVPVDHLEFVTANAHEVALR